VTFLFRYILTTKQLSKSFFGYPVPQRPITVVWYNFFQKLSNSKPNAMIKYFTVNFLIAAIWFSVVSCDQEEVVEPAKPTLTVDQTSGLVGDTLTFTITEVNADAISLLPYGLPGGDAGILVTDFTNGVAIVTFTYAKPGTFDAIAVANNHSGDGEIVKNVQSDPVTITIASDKSAITAFSFEGISTNTTIDEDAKTITVTVPHGTDVTDLQASFTASEFSTVAIDGTEQTSGTTVNDFSTPQIYTVTADNGATSDYTVTVEVTPVETINTISSITATAVSQSAGEKELSVSLDNTARTIVVFDTLGTPSTQFDSIRVGYQLEGEFATLKFGGQEMPQDTVLDLTSMKEFQVFSQDSTTAGGIQTYRVHAVDAPKLGLSFPGLNPDPAEEADPVNFNIDIRVLSGTDVSNINTLTTITAPAGVTVTGVKVDGATFADGTGVDYSEPVEFELTVNDANLGVTYTVTYMATVTVLR
jgi:hypothetical protein